MKAAGFVLIPLSLAWIGGGSWYIVTAQVERREIASSPVPAPPIRLGPQTETAAPTPELVVAVPDDRALRFAKNTGDFELSDEDLAWCKEVADILEANPATRLSLTGHTDSDGEPELNERLSLARARLVMYQLIDAGLPADRIDPEGKGAADPVSDNLTSKGKALNRRVEARLVNAR